MLKSIAQLSPDLLTFINSLDHSLNRPQSQHVARDADRLIVGEVRKTLSSLYRHIVGDLRPKAGGDSFRVSPWTAEDTSLSSHQVLNFFHESWACEVANWTIAEKLGWADCRLWQVEMVEKYMVLLWLALAYLKVRRAATSARNLAEVIDRHTPGLCLRKLVP